MKRGKTGATGRRGAKGARGATGRLGRRGTIGKRGLQGLRGLKGLAGTLHKAEILNQLVTYFEDVYLQLSAQAKRIAELQHQVDEIAGSLKNRR